MPVYQVINPDGLRLGDLGINLSQGQTFGVGTLPQDRVDQLLADGAIKVQEPATQQPQADPPPAQPINATPKAVQLAKARGLDLSTVKGTGRGGRIGVGDVRAALEDSR